MIVVKRELTAKQQRFCDEYLIDLNATQAAIRAGYSKKTAYSIGQENLKKPEINAHIEKRMAEKEEALIAKQDEVLKYLTAVMRGKSTSCVLARDDMGAEYPIQKPPDEREKLKAAELLGKRYSLFKENVQLDVQPVVIDGGDDLED